jgi:AcrR family transcriptional regulator
MAIRTEDALAPRRPGGRSARVRAAVVAATLDELTSNGYSGLTPDSVAARAGVHKTTVYRRWRTKEALVLDAMLQQAAQTVVVPDTGSLRGDLLDLARRSAAIQTSPAGEAVVRAVAGQAHTNADMAAASQRFWATRLRLDDTIVQRAKERGEIDAHIDPELVIEALLGPLYFRLLVAGQPLTAKFIDGLVDLVHAGCIRQAQSRDPRRAPSRSAD